MTERGDRLTTDQKRDLLSMGKKGFALTKAGRVLGLYKNKLKSMIDRESPSFVAEIQSLYPGVYAADDRDEEKDRWGPRVVAYEDLGPIVPPGGIDCLMARKRWDRSLGLRHGA